MKKALVLFMIIAAASTLVCGCSVKKDSKDEKGTVDFTVIEKEGVPNELASILAEKQKEAFTLSYGMDEYTYIAVGYGQQSTGGYSIRVDEMYETDTTITIHTTLIGPSAGEAVNKMATYPYIVIKIEQTDKNVVFE